MFDTIEINSNAIIGKATQFKNSNIKNVILQRNKKDVINVKEIINELSLMFPNCNKFSIEIV